MHAQIDRLAYAHTSFFTSDVAEALADQLTRTAPPDLARVYFVSGGSEAIEASLKMARQYFVEVGEPERSVFIARRQSYHGNTLGALAVGGNVRRRATFAPLLIDVRHVAPCYAYRDQRPDETSEAYGARLAAELDETIRACGDRRVIAFVAETVGGATGGALMPVPGYFKAVREVCDRHGVLLILDEVMCGMGRTGTLHACEQEGVVPDLLVIAKGLGGGYQPIGAVLAHEKIVGAMSAGSGFFQHGHTYLGHSVACAAALAVQQTIEREHLLANVCARGRSLAARLVDRFANHPHIGDIRGRGLFHALELVANRDTKAPFDASLQLHARVKRAGMARGLMTYPMGGTIDGVSGDHILLAPPFIVEEQHLDLLVDRLHGALDAAIASTRS
jgi:adenosylmethionine-8-amino-7-oxononanoate aminotransferase